MLYELIITLAIIALCIDVGYYVRALGSFYIGKWFQKKLNINDTAVYYGICTTRDSDGLFTHMNNSRYIRLTDGAKLNFWARVAITDKHSYFKVYMVIGAHSVRYRRPIGTFSLYKIETRISYWNKDSMYFEHKIITLKDGFVRAIVLSRTHAVGMETGSLVSDLPGADTLTEMPDELRHWEEALHASSGKIRQKGH